MDESFWDSLARKHGATGFTDYSIAFFDQLMRLKCIEQILSEHEILDRRNSVLLDFGCGTGDFLAYFSKSFKNVIGYDVSEEVLSIASHRLQRFSNIELLRSIENLDAKCDVVLSITVLQHILNDNELRDALSKISSLCKNGALLVAMESVSSLSVVVSHPPHLKARSLNFWVDSFKESGFEVVAVRSFYNPYLLVTPSYTKYAKSVRAQMTIYRGLRRLGFNPAFFNRTFTNCAERILNTPSNIDGIIDGDSFTKVFVVRKTS
jgi:ubiquinone/menaquinone biosynthesis C-methylase UbiE